jgi:hypothetical protein
MSQVEFEKLINDLVNTRHECAHLRSSTGFGITYGDARVGSDVEPLLVPLEVLAYEIVKKRWSKPSILSSASDISVCWFLWILKPEGEPMYLFNNCKNRRHAAMYGPHAFYDLNKTGYQATQANNLSIGETCVVASKHPRGSITFDWYKFLRETVKSDDTGIPCRAFYGDHFKTETLSRSDAMRNGIYSRFFDINGNFKRHSVLRG